MSKKLSTAAGAVILCLAAIITGIIMTGDKNNPPIETEAGEYVFAMISDTQFYSQNKPANFTAMTEFLAEQKDSIDLAYVLHTGDIVNSPYETAQWQAASDAFDKLGDIPYGVLPGNHDTGNSDRKYTDYSSFFGASRFENKPWYGESHENNRAHYDLITAGGRDFIIVYLSDDPSKCCVDFANAAFAKYPDRTGILCTHKYIDEEGNLNDMGQYMQKNIVAANTNVRLVLCGHESISGYITTDMKDKDGNFYQVQQIIANYQANNNDGGGGYMLFLIFNEEDKTIEGITYSPIRDDYIGHEDSFSIDEFTIALPW